MENENVIEMESEEIEEVKESKVKKFIGKVGSGIKKNWKPIVVGTVAFIAGAAVGKKTSKTQDDGYEIETEVAYDDTVDEQSFNEN